MNDTAFLFFEWLAKFFYVFLPGVALTCLMFKVKLNIKNRIENRRLKKLAPQPAKAND